MKCKTQKALARSLGYPSTKYIRALIHSLRMKGYGVCANRDGMYRTESREYKDAQAAALLARAKEIMAAAEGLVRHDTDEMTIEEEMLWLSLPEFIPPKDEIRTTFSYITEEDLK